MCGVTAIYSYKREAPPVNLQELCGIRDYMKHRGPDAKGLWSDTNCRVALAHRRLSVIDLSQRSDQPMKTQNEDYVISFNGEIYNYRELKNDLVKKGYRFETESDTEAILHLYQDKGESLCKYLRGMYAFVIWDRKKSCMILARDSYGIKPLYYSDDGKCIRVASQVKALRISSYISKNSELSPGGLVGFLLLGSIPEPLTTYKRIRSVPSGCLIVVNERGLRFNKYFSLCDSYQRLSNKLSFRNSENVVRRALLDSIKAHTIGDVPVGIFLSSGIDSCSLLALMTKVGYTDIHSLTLSFSEFTGTENDEAPLARKIASIYGTKHFNQVISCSDFNQYFPAILKDMDQPTIDGVNTWFVSKLAKEQGLKVALSGLGGDEIFGGYPAFKNVPRLLFVGKIINRIPGFKTLFRKTLNGFEKIKIVNSKYYSIPDYSSDIYDAYLLQRSIFLPSEIERILGKNVFKEGFNELAEQTSDKRIITDCPDDSFSIISALETNSYMKNQLLRDADWAGMSHSLEIRVPLVDTDFLRKVGPEIQKNKKYQNKYLLSKSSLSSDEIKFLKRKKSGFGLPLQKWFSASNVYTKRNSIMFNRNTHWSKRYALHVLEVFHGDICA